MGPSLVRACLRDLCASAIPWKWIDELRGEPRIQRLTRTQKDRRCLR